MTIRPALLALCLFALPAQADEISAQVQTIIEKELRIWAADPALVAAVVAAGVAHAGLDQTQIDSLDQLWRAEIGASAQPTIAPVLTHPVSQALKDRVMASKGRFGEVFLMDSRGLNVAMSGVTSDYWQGDEAKFQQTFPMGPDAIHIGSVEFDESSQTYQVQASFTVTDPTSGAPIGAMTVGLNAEMIH